MDATGNQAHTYGLSFWLPYHGTGSSQTGEYDIRSGMACPHFIACWDMRNRALDYDLFRRVVQQWREYAPNYFGDYYPLTAHSVDPSVWLAWQFDRPEAGKGMVQAFRRTESVYETARFRLSGLDPEARYLLTDLEANETRTLSGRELAESGLPVTIKTQPGAVVITYAKTE
jgi:alpha-galactosidase